MQTRQWHTAPASCMSVECLGVRVPSWSEKKLNFLAYSVTHKQNILVLVVKFLYLQTARLSTTGTDTTEQWAFSLFNFLIPLLFIPPFIIKVENDIYKIEIEFDATEAEQKKHINQNLVPCLVFEMLELWIQVLKRIHSEAEQSVTQSCTKLKEKRY